MLGARATRSILTLVLAIGAVTVVSVPTASADLLITVTTTADVVDASDGVISLREAVDQATASAQPVEITLAASATYNLTICNADENRYGTLQPITTQPVAVHGMGSTIHLQCAGREVISNYWPGRAVGSLSLDHLVIDGGRGSRTVAIEGADGLALDHVRVQNSVATSPNNGTAAVVGAGVVALSSTEIDGTEGGSGLRANDAAGQNSHLSVVDSRITNNRSTVSTTGGIAAARDLELVSSVVSGNHDTTIGLRSVGGVLAGDGTGTVSGFGNTIDDNTANRVGGVLGTIVLGSSSISGNNGTAIVGGVQGRMTLTDVRLENNGSDYVGGFVALGTITDSTIAGNHGGRIGAGYTDVPDNPPYGLSITRSTVAGNTGALVGGIVLETYAGAPGAPVQPHLELTSSTFAGNVGTSDRSANDVAFVTAAMVPGHVYVPSGSITSQGSIFGSIGNGRPACIPDAHTVTSGGYNFVADNSCGLHAPSDVSNGGDPKLAPLRTIDPAHTAVRVPDRRSPVRDRIPLGTTTLCPTSGGHDQRGVITPQAQRCDIGASEAILGGYHPSAPRRALDTRDAHVPLGPGETRTVTLFDPPADHSSAAIVNVTAVNQTAPSHLTVFASDSPMPATSNLNFAAGETIANQAVVPIGTGGAPGAVKIFNNAGQTDVIVDVEGFYDDGTVAPANNATLCPCGTALQPRNTRVLDSRTGIGTSPTKFGPGETRTLDLGGIVTETGADAVVLNLTVTDADAGSHLTVAPGGQPLPTASNLNWTKNKTIAVAATVALPPSKTLQLHNNAGNVNVIVDLYGVYSASGARFRVIDPVRLLDTRNGAPLGPGASRTVDVVTPNGAPLPATALTFNLTGVSPTADTHLTVYTGAVVPDTSAVNIPAGGTRPNLVTGGAGSFKIRNNAGVANVVVDLDGWFEGQPVLS